MMTGLEVVVLIGCVAMTLAAGVCFLLAAAEARRGCPCERCREERAGIESGGDPALDRVWARVGRKVRQGKNGTRRSASLPAARVVTHDDGKGAA